MNCEELRRRLQDRNPPSEEDVAPHLAECAPCRELWRDQGWLGLALGNPAVPEPSAEVWAGVQAEVAQEIGPVAWLRARPTWQRGILLACGFLLPFVAGFLLRPRTDFEALDIVRWATEGVVLIALGAMSIGGGLRPLQRRSWSARAVGGVVLLAMVATGVLFALPADHVHPEDHAFLRNALVCFVEGGLWATPVVALAVLTSRGANTRERLGMLALGAALSGVLALHGQCAIAEPLHLLAGHWTLLLASVGAFAWQAIRQPLVDHR